MIKNQAGQVVQCGLTLLADGTDYAAAAVVYVKPHGGPQAVGAGVVTQIGHGLYEYAPTQAETNYDAVAFSFTAGGVGTQTITYEPVDPQAIWSVPLNESYANNGHAGSAAQLLYMIQQSLLEFGIEGTLRQIKGLDHTTIVAECQYDAIPATSTTRAS